MTTTTHKIANFFSPLAKKTTLAALHYIIKRVTILHESAYFCGLGPFRSQVIWLYFTYLLKLQLRAFGTFELQSFTASPKSFAHSNLEKLITPSSMNPLLSSEKT